MKKGSQWPTVSSNTIICKTCTYMAVLTRSYPINERMYLNLLVDSMDCRKGNTRAKIVLVINWSSWEVVSHCAGFDESSRAKQEANISLRQSDDMWLSFFVYKASENLNGTPIKSPICL